jgi:hypothetical protein
MEAGQNLPGIMKQPEPVRARACVGKELLVSF